ncbi:MAG: hypothetical protein AB1489_24915 [Acidobacteriota bacterium]
MEKKDLELAQNAATANGEEPSDLEDLGEEEVAQAVEGLKLGQGERGSSPSIVHDPKMEAEIKEMFRDIVSQFITPVGKSIRALLNGDLSERNIDICIGALKPLILAAEEIHYNDIYDVLKSIEQPLVSFREGKKRLLSKKDIRNISTDYRELMRLISRSVGSEMIEMNSTGAMPATAAGLNPNDPIALTELQVSDRLAFFNDIDPHDIQRLYAAGLIKLSLLSQATGQEISESTGIALAAAEKLKQCAINALASLTNTPPAASLPTTPPVVGQDIPVGRQTGRLDLDDDEASIFNNSKQRWLTALEAINDEMAQYYQAITALNTELERTHRALVRMRVARERFKGEIEFYHDDLVDMFETTERLNEEVGTPTNAHRQLLKNLRRAIDVVSSALKKTEVIYSQIDDTVEDAQDMEAQLIALRRRKGAAAKNTNLRRRTTNDAVPDPIDEADAGLN